MPEGEAAGGAVGARPARVAIVIPAFNRERFIAATIDAVLAQTFADWQLIVFDDGSTDRTRAIASQYAVDPRITVTGGPNGGVAAARNRGLAASDPRTEFVVFLDSDDLWEPDALESFVRVLDSHPEFVSVHSNLRSIDEQGRPIPGDDLQERTRRRKGIRNDALVEIALDEPTTFAEFVVENVVQSPGTQLIRRSVLAQVGELDVATDPADDWDLVIRISRYGPSGFIDRPLLQWRRHSAALSNTTPRLRQGYFRTRDRALMDSANTPEQRRAAKRAYALVVRAAVAEIGRTGLRQPTETARQLARAGYASLRYARALSLSAERGLRR
jgi:glycosyltransferase involved in cell wall biosynthesis